MYWQIPWRLIVVAWAAAFASAVCQCGHAAPLLPDLIAWASESNNYMYGGEIEESLIPGKTVYRFDGALPNIGSGPLEVRLEEVPNGSQNVYQRVHDLEGGVSEVLIDNFMDAASLPPRRLFLPGIARYNLRTVLGEDGLGPVVSTWDKTSMALVDGRKYDQPPPGTPPNAVYNSLSSDIQGVSVGWADIYGRNLPGQWADATGLADGEYWLEVIADPENRVQESDETNNATRIKVNLTIPEPTLLVGDFNRNGSVDAADYTVWRNSLGDIVAMGTGADGDLSGKIGSSDYEVWKDHFGAETVGAASVVPEPRCLTVTSIAFVGLLGFSNRGRSQFVSVQLGA